jgi:hypothetical protein
MHGARRADAVPLYLFGFAHVFNSPLDLNAMVTTRDKLLHLGVLTSRLTDNNANKAQAGRVVTLLKVVQSEAFEATLESVDAAKMQSELGSAGYVTLYGSSSTMTRPACDPSRGRPSTRS